MTTNERGQLRFPVLLPGTYVLDIELAGFAPYHEVNITSARARRSNGQSY
jgi:hypothetical protein